MIKLNLSAPEKAKLRSHRVKKSEVACLTSDEIAHILEVSFIRAREIRALAAFQSIPSIGNKFAEDLIFMECYSLDELQGKKGAQLLDAYEHKKGYRTDPCVEDQFRLAVNYAKHKDSTKKWWDFTSERKKYRSENGYPADRPDIPWHEAL